MKRILALLLIAAPLMADEASEIKAHFANAGTRDLERYVKHVTTVPKIGETVTTNMVARPSVTNELELIAILTQPPISIPEGAINLPLRPGAGRQLRKVIHNKIQAAHDNVTDLVSLRDYVKLLQEATEALSMWQELAGDGVIYDLYFSQATEPVETRTPIYGQSIAQANGWTGFLAAQDKVAYLLGVLR